MRIRTRIVALVLAGVAAMAALGGAGHDSQQQPLAKGGFEWGTTP